MELSEEPVELWQKLRAVGEECMKKKEFEGAIASFEAALDIAIKFPEMFTPSDLVKVHVKIANAHIKLKKYDSVLNILHHPMSISDDISECYTLMSQAYLGIGDSVNASCSLLRGIEKCQLNEEQLLSFVTMAATHLADLKLSIINGDNKEEDILTVSNIKPNLPSLSSFWNDVIHHLWQRKAIAALAFITCGLPGPQASILEKTAVPYGCSCEGIEIQTIYETLSAAQLKGWGHILAIFILEHGGTIVCQPEETTTVVLIKNSLKSGSAELLKHALEGGMVNSHLDSHTSFGDTALHFLVKSRPFTQLHEEMVHLLVSHGALPNVVDSTGNIPIHYVQQSEAPSVFLILRDVLEKPNEGFIKRIMDLKEKGDAAHQSKEHHVAIFFYEVAINTIEASRYDMWHDKAVLYNSMAAECTRVSCDDLASAVINKSRNADPVFHKPYCRLGKCLMDKGKVPEACAVLMEGLACEEVDIEQRLPFLQEICSNFSALSESQVNAIVYKMASFLPTCWPKLMETLSRTASAESWDIVRCLVLGPPEKEIAQTIVNPGWKYADRFKEKEKLKVGYAMCLKAQTPILSTLAEVVDRNEGCKVHEWATDLTLALLLQGAELTSLATSDDETAYHVALHMCCHTGKLGLLKYILSEAKYLQEARKALTKEARTLLHSACLEFGFASHPVGQEIVKLLLEKGFDPSCEDIMEKKAVHYVNPNSIMYQLLSDQQVTDPQSAKELKDLGNSEFKKGNYVAASQYYSQAIDVVKQMLPPLDHMMPMLEHHEEKHKLAVLFSNRAECYIKMDKVEEALNDANDSVSWNGHWYRGHLQVARALQWKNKTKMAVKAYCNAYNALDETSTEAQQKEILKELITSLITVSCERSDRIPNLGFVPAELWAEITYDFLCEAIERNQSDRAPLPTDNWDAANLSFSLFSMTQNLAPKPVKVNLKRLCTWFLSQKAIGTAMDLILYFLKSGSDHTALSFYEGDTYIHAAIFIAILSGNTKVLDWVMKMHAIPRGEVNLQDKEGNTALHIMACKHHPPHRIPSPPFEIVNYSKMCEKLLDCGVNPCIKNNQGQTALDCLERDCDHGLQNLLEKATKKELQPQTEAIPFIKETQTTLNGATNSAITNLDERDDVNRPRPRQQSDCDLCEEFLAYARSSFDYEEKITSAYFKLVSILGYSHRDQRHDSMVAEAQDMIVEQLSKSLSPDVPDMLLNISEPHLVSILEILASRGKWQQMEAVVNKAHSNDVPCGQFAKNMSIPALIADKGLCGKEMQRVQIQSLLVANGAQLPSTKGKEVVITAVQHNEFHVVEKLIEIGADPQGLSLEPGDTPLHAALAVALDKDEGYFSLLEKLLDLHYKDPEKYSLLNPNTTDSDGNTLLHAATKAKYSKHSQKAVEMLVSLGVSVAFKNCSGMAAIDNIKVHNDGRAQYLHVTSMPSGSYNQEQKNSDLVTMPKSRLSSKSKSLEEMKVLTKSSKRHQQVEEKPAPKREIVIDIQNFKVKTAIENLQAQVKRLKEITSAEARVAKAAKERWLEITKPTTDNTDRYGPLGLKQAIIVGEKDVEDAESASPTVSEDNNQKMGLKENEGKIEQGYDTEIMDLLTFDNLEWELECTSKVWRTLHDKWVPQVFKNQIVKCLNLLAQGKWRSASCQLVQDLPGTLKLYQAEFAEGMCILWELAIAFSPRLSAKEQLGVHGGRVYTEIIRVWDIIFQHQKIHPSVQHIIQSHQQGKDGLIQKKHKSVKNEYFQGGRKKCYPMIFTETDVDQESLASLSEKFYCFSSALVYCVLKNADSKINFPFRVTDKEHAVINLHSKTPILLFGQSGTGKTTCCLFRLWSRFVEYWSKPHEMNGDKWLHCAVQYAPKESVGNPEGGVIEGNQNANKEEYDLEEEEAKGEADSLQYSAVYSHLHQLYVTKHHVLCSEMQKNFHELSHANDVAARHVIVEDDPLPQRLQEINEFKYPLFLTLRQLIQMLDASLPPPFFFEYNEDGSLKAVIEGWGEDKDIFAINPLTHGSENDDLEDDDRQRQEDQIPVPRARTKDSRRVVTYEVFTHEIWPLIIKKAKVKGNSPSLVWTEITSLIKGSFEALTQPSGFLDKDKYENLGKKQAPNFTGNRDQVYKLFLAYNDYKRQLNLYDEGDLVFNIYKRLQTMEQLPWILDEIIVDDAQDFTQAELTVLIHLAQNPNNIFLTGDTIRGGVFRFTDLKALFYCVSQSLHTRGKTKLLEVPKQIYQLNYNYRSHTGILSLASAVLDLLVEFFPESFDCLEKNKGVFHGPKPVVLESCKPADLAILLTGNKCKKSQIELGVHQVILVANEEARNSLPEDLSSGLVLTISEAKEMAFRDVLLYNFFKDSQASKEWRVVTDFLERLSRNKVRSSCASLAGLVEISHDEPQQKGRP